ncbi:MAG: hypothetical protein CM15mP103_13120 [Gammaproteobacteria bacterium]|nr:MAG: hypothetical protein CM15mP103_13120 [Gammaproteobacteria bacterium]
MSLYSGRELDKNQANFAPLTPVSVLKRTERVYPDLPAQIHGVFVATGERSPSAASFWLRRFQAWCWQGDTVALIAPNIPEALECALAIPLLGAVLNANNVGSMLPRWVLFSSMARPRCYSWIPSSPRWREAVTNPGAICSSLILRIQRAGRRLYW